MRLLLLNLFVLLLCPTPCFAEFLKGGVSESLNVERLPQGQRLGEILDRSKLPTANATSRWVPIPNWFAGEWKRETVYGQTGKRKDVRVRNFGFQTDVRGQVWHFIQTPRYLQTEQAQTTALFLIRQEELTVQSEDAVGTRSIMTEWVTNKASGKIVAVNQNEQIDTFDRGPSKRLSVTASAKSFDEDGKVTSEENAWWTDVLLRRYEPINIYQGVDVRRLFEDFMNTQRIDFKDPEHSKQ